MEGISIRAAGKLQNKDKTFQGQKFDDDLDIDYVEFKYRNHDPQIGRFIEIDPLAVSYEYNSSYAFSENKVTAHVELEGLEAAIATWGDKNEVQQDRAFQQRGVLDGTAYNKGFERGFVVGAAVTAGVVGSLAFPTIAAPIITADLFGVPSPTAPTSAVTTVAAETKTIVSEVNTASAELKPLTAIEQRAAKLSEVSREGKDFTKAGKDVVKDINKAKNGGQMKCDGCNTNVQPGKQSVKGVKPPSNEAQVDHIDPKSKGGSGTPNNGQVLCRECNLKKGVN